VVVASAGNTGPEPITIRVPGNAPYVITVGTVSDNWTPGDPSDDVLASFSAAGPTYDGFVKPELVAAGGGHMLGIMDHGNHKIARDHPEWITTDGRLYVMSGSSQSAAAVVSGVVALILEADPTLSPDDVNCRLMATARPAVHANGHLAYSILQRGAGLVDAFGAVGSLATGCANRGLDVTKDLAGLERCGGLVNQNGDGNYARHRAERTLEAVQLRLLG
jgi:serine protease AprX